MGNTPNFAIPYPEPTDFVSDGAQQMENLAERADLGMFALGSGRNRLINGDMRIAQRGTSFTSTGSANNDNTYNLDRWCLLSDGNDIVDVTQANVAPTGGIFSIGLDVETANKKFGILQVIEQRNIAGVFGQNCTLSFYARTTGSSIANLKAVVLSWTGTADSVTRDVVSAWNADGVTPTWATNWTAENTPTNLAPSNNWTRYAITMNVDTANLNNVAVFIWCDDMTTTVGDFLYVTDVQFEVGALATPFERRDIGTELIRCMRYYQGYPYGGIAEQTALLGYSPSAYYYGASDLQVPMRTTPSTANTGTNYWRRPTDASLQVATTVYFNATATGTYWAFVCSSGGYHALAIFTATGFASAEL